MCDSFGGIGILCQVSFRENKLLGKNFVDAKKIIQVFM